MIQDKDDAVIVRSTIDLAHNLGLKVVAEGVENVETLKLLRELGCDLAQGTTSAGRDRWSRCGISSMGRSVRISRSRCLSHAGTKLR